jgi:type II secretory pathway pseudopilin PulG
MNEINNKILLRRGLTLLEVVLAMVMITIIFAAVLPQFAMMGHSWDSKQGSAEALQNGRVLMDHISRNLSKAVRITAVSEADDSGGHIEFEDTDGNIMRYQLNDNYVEYGPVGNLSDVAGITTLTFTCYDACDLDNPVPSVADLNNIRVVKVDAIFTNSASAGDDKAFSAIVYLRTNGDSQNCWHHQDIGSVAVAGSATSSTCDWTIIGSGVDIWGTADEFHYVYQRLSGDGQIVARVVSLTNTNSWAKAGVMIRETLTAGSKHALMVVTPGSGNAFQRRTSTSGNSTTTAGSAVTAPYWVKLTRVGNNLTSYESSNGSIWTQVGTDTVSMATDVYIGLCVTSHNDGILCTAAFDNISISEVTWSYNTFNEAKGSADVTSLAVSRPTVTAGNLLIAAVATDGDTSSTITAPSGWTLIDRGSYGSAVTLAAWWKIATAAEPASYTFSWTGSQQSYGWMMRFIGNNTTSPINASAATGGSSSSPTSPAVTTTVDNCLILRLGAFDDGDINVDAPGLAGHTTITMDSSSATSGLVGYWKLDESSGATIASDSSGSGNNGTLVNMTPASDWVTGKVNNGLDFDGSNDYVNCGNNASLNITSNITVAAWVKTRDCGNSQHNPYVVKGDTSYALKQRSDNYAEFFIYDAGNWYAALYQVNSSFNNVWHHLAGTYDGLKVKLYVDGVLRNTVNHNGSIASNNYNVQLGKDAQNTDRLYDGVLDSVRIYNRALSAAEITQLYQWTGDDGVVSGGAGYVTQPAAGSSGTSTFAMKSSNEARTLTIAIAPDDMASSIDACCQNNIIP